MQGCCSHSQGEVLVFTCAGAAYSGQVANRAGVEVMKKRGLGQLFCITALAAEQPDKLQRARDAACRVVIDGCEDACARKIAEKAGLPVDAHLVVTDLGIEKQPAEPHVLVHARRVVDELAQRMTGRSGTVGGPLCCA